jgi:hypothetical protein
MRPSRKSECCDCIAAMKPVAPIRDGAAADLSH